MMKLGQVDFCLKLTSCKIDTGNLQFSHEINVNEEWLEVSISNEFIQEILISSQGANDWMTSFYFEIQGKFIA